MIRTILSILILCTALSGCKNEIQFDKPGWTSIADLGMYPQRYEMLDDLIKNHKLVGLSCRQLFDKLGHPENYSDVPKNAIYYNIVTDYGHNIDPVYVKNLMFQFDGDSIITNFTVLEHKN